MASNLDLSFVRDKEKICKRRAKCFNCFHESSKTSGIPSELLHFPPFQISGILPVSTTNTKRHENSFIQNDGLTAFTAGHGGALIGAVATVQAAGQENPTSSLIMGDDIGMWNIGARVQRHDGRHDAQPRQDGLGEGMLFTDYYAEASCTAGSANFIMGELPIRTGMTTVGQVCAAIGILAEACTIATALKAQGYATGQFSKKSFGRQERIPLLPFTASMNSSATCITLDAMERSVPSQSICRIFLERRLASRNLVYS